ncbi:MAG: efflux RND transporter periplasmic adaptor subunit [Roseobacter sp.]
MVKLIPKLLCLFLLITPAISRAEESTLYDGRVEALNRVDVSAQVEGVVTEIHFQPGQRVEEGFLLFSFDDLEVAQRTRAAEAVAQKAAALFDDAKQEYDRNQELRERGTIADSRYFKSKAAVAIAAAAVAETNSRLQAAKLELKRTKVYAPISGIISPALVSRGSYVETGRKGVLATIVQLDPVRIAYEIPYPDRLVELGITDLNSIATYADTVDLVVKLTPDWEHPELAEPTFLSSDVDPETRSLTAWAVVANPTRTLRPGMEVQVKPLAAESARPKQ